MPLPATDSGKSYAVTADNDIEFASIKASRQPKHCRESVDQSMYSVAGDVDNEETKTEAQNKYVLPTEGRGFTTESKSKDDANNLDESNFEDEHIAADDPSARRNNISCPLSQQPSLTSLGGGNNMHDETAAEYATQERRDEAFVQKFWTAYDEILILSLFTQMGILCRLGAAYWFRYFDNVFHSNSALFTNLPLNCLSCFVMGLLCSGESLMQVITTRFTPPRLQHDLHREATQQQEEFNIEDEMGYKSYNNSEETRNGDDDTSGNNGNKLKLRRRRQRWKQRIKWSENDDQSSRNRLSSLFRRQNQQQAQNPEIFDELREVQLLAWERRIRASVCLLLFPVKKEDIDIVENYFDDGYRQERNHDTVEEFGEHMAEDSKDTLCDIKSSVLPNDCKVTAGGFDDLIFDEEVDNSSTSVETKTRAQSSSKSSVYESFPKKALLETTDENVTETRMNESLANAKFPVSRTLDENTNTYSEQGLVHPHGNVHISARQYGQVEGGNLVDYGTRDNPDLDQIISNMATGVSNKISFIGRVNLANGWDVGTSPQEKSEDLTLGLRDGLCGALSSFSSWISSMVNLFRAGQIGEAFVGLTIGIQLPIVAYRFGQYVSVYIFVWRCRREKRRDERRGYGIQLHNPDEEILTSDRPSFDAANDSSVCDSQKMTRTKGRRTVHDEDSDVPSIRAIFTALFITCLVAQLTSLNFFKKPEDRLLALSLLFSPLGVLARWRMMKFNSWRPSFPLGTFACNVTACALSGTLGSLIAGNPGPRERIALVSIIAGFGGTLSSVARFIVEILSLMDPILFRLDGIYYAIASVGTGLLFSFLFAASVDWADSVE